MWNSHFVLQFLQMVCYTNKASSSAQLKLLAVVSSYESSLLNVMIRIMLVA